MIEYVQATNSKVAGWLFFVDTNIGIFFTFVAISNKILFPTETRNMVQAKNFFASNLRLLRTRRKQTQEEFSEMLDIKRNKLQALESGKTANPAMVDIIKFSEYFKISVDTLLKVDVAGLSEYNLRELEAGNDVFATGSKLRVLAISADKTGEENVEYVPLSAKAGYVAAYNDPEFIGSLAKCKLPILPNSRTYRMFPITGDSMLPIQPGDHVIAEYIENWWEIKPGSLCIAVLKQQQDIILKAVTPVREKSSFLFESYNRQYRPYEVPVSEILEVWGFKSYISSDIPRPIEDIEEIGFKIKEIYDHVIAKRNS